MRARTLSLIAAGLVCAACQTQPDLVVRKWYPDGRIAEERGYSRGEKTGTHRGWWPNGMPQFECRFVNGKSAGMCREWYSDGRLATVHRFERGTETGLQQGWSPAGTPQFSYVIRDGRRYGMLGTLNCKTGARTGGAL
jgi:antitoxin component YwqK of YwqJK toxin-antitoxin module